METAALAYSLRGWLQLSLLELFVVNPINYGTQNGSVAFLQELIKMP